MEGIAEHYEELKNSLPEGTSMEEFVENVSKMASQFVEKQRQNPTEIQLLVFFVFLLIPISLILFCFCKILKSQKKPHGKDKKKQKEQKKDSKKRA